MKAVDCETLEQVADEMEGWVECGDEEQAHGEADDLLVRAVTLAGVFGHPSLTDKQRTAVHRLTTAFGKIGKDT